MLLEAEEREEEGEEEGEVMAGVGGVEEVMATAFRRLS